MTTDPLINTVKYLWLVHAPSLSCDFSDSLIYGHHPLLSQWPQVTGLILAKITAHTTFGVCVISYFFPTPILEIRVNVKRNFYRWGNFYWGKMTRKALQCTTCSPRIQTFSGGPPDPLPKIIPFRVPLTICVHLPPSFAIHFSDILTPTMESGHCQWGGLTDRNVCFMHFGKLPKLVSMLPILPHLTLPNIQWGGAEYPSPPQ